MRDVGARAGVSFKTVSRVVNGEPGVSPALAARVRDAVAELGYQRDLGASTLRRADRRTQTIATVLEDIGNPFSSGVLRAIVEAAAEHEVLVLAASSFEDMEQERSAVAAFATRRVDGLILMPTSGDHGWFAPELARGTHLVCVDRPAAGLAVDAVVADNRDGVARAVDHLVRRGHRRIAYLGDLARIYTAAERRRGYEEGLVAAGLTPDEALVRMDLGDSDAARDAVVDLLTARLHPTAVIAGQNLLTLGALRAMRRLELQRSVALVGFDDLESADLLDPGVTVVAQDPAAMGRAAVEELLARIGADDTAPRTRVIPTRLIPRGSGEIPPS
jgi:LacI family transcriptional regulator